VDATELAHLLRRTEIVVRPERVAALLPGTRAAAVDAVMAFDPTPVPVPSFIDHDIDGQGYDQFVYAVKWWMDRFVDSPTPFQEKLTLFWHGHFCSSWEKVNSARAMTAQNALFRAMSLGNFRTLTRAMAVQPAMLVYLDNVDNVKTSPNQNFARELMELFTLGVGNYSEDDVTAAARAWTGHGVDGTTGDYLFRVRRHDTDPKTFMGVTRNWDGPEIIDFLLRENAATAMTACRFLTRKLWTFLAHENPAGALVDELAKVLFDADMEMRPWVRAMLVHDAFHTVTARQGMVRSPVEYMTAIAHHTGLRSADLNPQWSMEGDGTPAVQTAERGRLEDQRLLAVDRGRVGSGQLRLLAAVEGARRRPAAHRAHRAARRVRRPGGVVGAGRGRCDRRAARHRGPLPGDPRPVGGLVHVGQHVGHRLVHPRQRVDARPPHPGLPALVTTRPTRAPHRWRHTPMTSQEGR